METNKDGTAKPFDAAHGSGYVVELQQHVRMWIAPWQGDPGRTCVEATAVRYKTESAAKAALTRARRYSPFKQARIYIPNDQVELPAPDQKS